MRIRRADSGDALAVATVRVRSWQGAYPGLMPRDFLDGMDPSQRREGWERILAATDWPRSAVLLAEGDSGVVGFAGLCPMRDGDADPAAVGEIAAFYVLPEFWGRGVGRALMAESLFHLQRGGVRVVDTVGAGPEHPGTAFLSGHWMARGRRGQEG